MPKNSFGWGITYKLPNTEVHNIFLLIIWAYLPYHCQNYYVSFDPPKASSKSGEGLFLMPQFSHNYIALSFSFATELFYKAFHNQFLSLLQKFWDFNRHSTVPFLKIRVFKKQSYNLTSSQYNWMSLSYCYPIFMQSLLMFHDV